MAAVLALMVPGVAAARTTKIASVPVSFQVANTNAPGAPKCAPDGATYTVRGHITGPAGFRPAGATLYLHGLGLGEWLWNFPVQRYSFVRAMARAGHVSVSVDRLGYGQSDRP